MERVEAVETKASTLESRLDSVEQSLGAVGSGDLVAFQKQILVSLRAIRDSLREEEKARAATQAVASNEALVEENAALKKQVAKLNYRIEHLLRHIPEPKQ